MVRHPFPFTTRIIVSVNQSEEIQVEPIVKIVAVIFFLDYSVVIINRHFA